MAEVKERDRADIFREIAEKIADIKRQTERSEVERVAIWAFARGLEFTTEIETLTAGRTTAT